MSIDSALIDIRLPAAPKATKPRNDVIAVIRRLVGRPRWLQEQPHLKLGDSYRIPDGRGRGSSWLHTHH
jgi:hypothetical protein